MGRNTRNLGKPVANSLGYTVRMMVGTKTDEKTKKINKVHNGKYGIYAGKKLKEEVKNVAEAMEKINKMANK